MLDYLGIEQREKTMNRLRTPLYCALAAMPMAVVNTTSAQLLIDGFDTEQVVAEDIVGSITDSSELIDPGVLGGERDMIASFGTGALGAVGLSSDGVLSFSNSPASTGSLALTYDGTDFSSTPDIFGLGGIDLTTGGTADSMLFTLLFADFEVEYTIAIGDMSGALSFYTDTLPSGLTGPGSVDVIAPFSDFSNPAIDLTDIGFVQLVFEAQEPAADIVIDNFRTDVPEPTSIALLLAGGALLARRRRRV